jgi:cell division septation protein DedD
MDEKELQTQLATRFKKLPKVVQDAITSAEVEKHLRALSEKHKLHLDQWAVLENEVMLTMVGLEKPADLAKNIAREVGVQEDVAEALAADISATVFAPVRVELERLVPDAEGSAAPAPAPVPPPQATPAIAPVPASAATPTPIPAAPTTPPAPAQPIIAATPPRTAPTTKIERAPVSNAYGAAVASHERVAIEGDPYREQVK